MNELATTAPGPIAASGAELVELAERFYLGIVASCLLFVGLSSAAALALLPTRDTTATWSTPTVWLAIGLVAATPIAVCKTQAAYKGLRRRRAFRFTLVAVAAAMLAYPLRSELWWPACALLMLLATLTPHRELASYCLTVLTINLVAHAIAGDYDDIRAVTIIGLWVGFGFWPAAFALIPDRLAAFVLTLNARPHAETPRPLPPQQVPAAVVVEPSEVDEPRLQHEPAGGLAEAKGLPLTARQLEVVALLIDGLRYDEVAACLSITERQVRRHVQQAIARTGVENANHLAALYRARKLV